MPVAPQHVVADHAAVAQVDNGFALGVDDCATNSAVLDQLLLGL